MGRWYNPANNVLDISDAYRAINPSTGLLGLPADAVVGDSGDADRGLKLKQFQATFGFGVPSSSGNSSSIYLVFNAKDEFNYDEVAGFNTSASHCVWARVSNGSQTSSDVGPSGAVPGASYTQRLWLRAQSSGTAVTAWAIVNNLTDGPTSESDWSAIASSLILSTSLRASSGGMIGFEALGEWYSAVTSNVTIKSWDASTSAYDITEAYEPFTVDSSGYADDTLSNDSDGNLTYDGLQAYTYDAWNRLKTVAHAAHDSGGTLQIGQASVTCGYDARGRRVSKAVANTGPWDCTYHYYLDQDSVVEEQNGSAETIKQFLWGTNYIDELVQTSLNSSPTTQSTCDTPYWAMQDANWNVLGIVNSSGTLTERYQYSAYGQRQVYDSAGSNDPQAMTPIPFSQKFVVGSAAEPYGLCEVGFQGLMQDEESGLNYARNRYGQPTLGRWMEEDPLSYGAGLDVYLVDADCPETKVDPNGLCPKRASTKEDLSCHVLDFGPSTKLLEIGL